MAPEIFKGLKDVYLDTTKSSFIDGQEGKLLYRGYNIHDLAEKSTFEEVVYLLFYGSFDIAATDRSGRKDARGLGTARRSQSAWRRSHQCTDAKRRRV